MYAANGAQVGAAPMGIPPYGAYPHLMAGGGYPHYDHHGPASQDFPNVGSHTNSKDPAMVKARVFVGNLNTFRVSREDLVALFQTYGQILGVNLCKGYAFVQYSNPTEADICVKALNNYTWEGSQLDVKSAFNSPAKLRSKKDSNTTTLPNAPPVTKSTSPYEIFANNRAFSRNFQSQSFEPHAEGSFEDVLVCGECRFRTNDINDYAEHRRRECAPNSKPPKEPTSIQCFTCDDTFECSWKLLQHLTEKHNLNLYRNPHEDDEESVPENRGPCTPEEMPPDEEETAVVAVKSEPKLELIEEQVSPNNIKEEHNDDEMEQAPTEPTEDSSNAQ